MILISLLMGCINDTSTFKQVEIVGSAIPQSSSETGTLNLIAYHAWYGEGDLEYPCHEFARTESTELTFEWTVDIPQEEGEGLAIRAWLDTNEDGDFCTPDNSDEYGGTVVFDSIDWLIEVDIELNDPCGF